MPASANPAPLQQSSLAESWRRNASTQAISKNESAATTESSAMDVDTKSTTPESDSVAEANVSKRRMTSNSQTAAKSKRRRVIDSDDEGDDIAQSTTSTSLKTFPGSSEKKDKDVKSRPKTVNDLMKTPKHKSVLGDAESEPAKSSAAEEEDAPIDDDEGLLMSDNEEGIAAVKNAQFALDRLVDVDIKGGWKQGDPVPYAALTGVFAKIEATSKRLEITALLTSFLLLVIKRSKHGDSNSLRMAAYLCINRLCPDYQGLELGIGESLLQKAIAQSTGRKLEAIKVDLKAIGDLGLVAQNSKGSQKTLFKPKPLTMDSVFAKLTEIAKTSGHASQSKKVGIIQGLLASSNAESQEAKYIIRSLEGKLRIGLAERTLIIALAHAVVLWENDNGGSKWGKETLALNLEEGANTLKSVFSELPSYDLVVPALLAGGIKGVRENCKLTPGIPLKPMLAKPTKAITEVLDRFEGKRFTCEYKYDGERAQVHKLADGSLAVFSRNSEDMSAKYPDLVEQLPKAVAEGTKSFVLDTEAVAFDRETMGLLPFQELSRRKRKDVKVEDIKVRVCLFAFDLLYLNDESLLHKSLLERRELLKKHFVEVSGEFAFAKASDGETTEEIQVFLDESVKDGCEGLMVKSLETDASFYEPSRRSVNWLKLKKDYLKGVGDTFDLVVVGGYFGKGKRTSVYGAFLLACYDQETERFQTVCKLGTGFSEEALKANQEMLKALELSQCRSDVEAGGAKPDVWFEPKVVWEILAADLSLSPIYSAAMGAVDSRGISLRFPRFIRVRDDKDADDATSSEQVAEMYERQALASKSGKKGQAAADDFW